MNDEQYTELNESIDRLNNTTQDNNNAVNDLREYLEEKDNKEQEEKQEKEEQQEQEQEQQTQEQQEQEQQTQEQQETYTELLTDIKSEIQLSNQMFAGQFMMMGIITGIILFKILWDKLQ